MYICVFVCMNTIPFTNRELTCIDSHTVLSDCLAVGRGSSYMLVKDQILRKRNTREMG